METLSTPRRRILVIANPTAGSRFRHRLAPMLGQLEARGCDVSLYETKSAGDGERYLREADAETFDAIVAAGGDGTINEVLNGMPLGGPPLAILPLGTINLLAEEIGLSSSPEAIAETVIAGPSRRISIGEINGRRFAVMASVGLDAEVVERVNLDLKRHIGKGAYIYETIRRMILSSPPIFQVRIDGKEHQAHGVIIANGRFYAGPYVAAPEADIEKPSLDVCRLERSGRSAAPRYLMSLVLGQLAARPDVQMDQATDLELLGPAGAPVQADGDLICRLPATVRVLPGAVNLVFPKTPRAAQAGRSEEKTMP